MSNDVVKALNEANRKVRASTRGLSQLVPSSGPSAGPVPITPSGLGDIFAALLTQLKTTTTTLALAFKPPLSPDAIKPYADRLEDQVARSVSCVLALAGAAPPNAGSSALVETWKSGVMDIGEAVEAFLAVMEDAARTGAVDKEGEQSPYLAHTGLVHAAIDRLASNFPRTEGEAVGRVWESQKGTMTDAWDEFKEMLEDDDEEEEEDFGDDLDDEWGILEAPMAKLSVGERKRAEAAKPVLKLHQILHATIPRFLPPLVLSPEESYADLLSAGQVHVGALDDAVSSFHPVQDSREINKEVDKLNIEGRALATAFASRLARAGREHKTYAVAFQFVTRWEAKLAEEVAKWEENRVSLTELGDALA
ncbi:hypothetical protein CcaverHIS002_0701740 [Cutaneotrichosporon cavernicola]|uniref:Cyclin-D1-binding protein 1-like N-terminal domain-containing protein n=1 Tax=Cutaneotrichosporon cavernicola TaxID=279322 RepID=A0AA48QYT3_9TREE|nr:uncharacterized protein CcaverHIS019_0701770 [Cutaneotrichosporon cavernicola]BEI86828.1 hypothetical protein CcaverHIS002_0701740 [Cutaneotrichosporon cavernicola]BEI94605.1 hypothetical protein CcaverHIS019_0701770 [Cutaneotrichosporon cavernicola]BEJ02382.1 hypothetical protein CcaverHIS631_0701770 [Cutaneotrichosporon cavernicola]BEJ10139.1 hypothetical protein CcaverHIS641_0701740 [Cutaneotrichosporon cavernicola]